MSLARPTLYKQWLVLGLDIAVCLLCAVGTSAGITHGYTWFLGSVGPAPSLQTLGIWAVSSVLLLQNTAILGYLQLRAGAQRAWLIRGISDGNKAMRTGTASVIAVPLVLVVNIVVGALFAAMGVQHNQSALFPLAPGDTFGQAGFFLMAAVFVPMVEEVFFRGYVYGRVAGFASPGVGIIVSAVVFAAAHSWSASVGSIALVAQTCALGFCLGWIRQRSQSIFPSMIAHGVNNAVALLLVLSCVNHPELGCART